MTTCDKCGAEYELAYGSTGHPARPCRDVLAARVEAVESELAGVRDVLDENFPETPEERSQTVGARVLRLLGDRGDCRDALAARVAELAISKGREVDRLWEVDRLSVALAAERTAHEATKVQLDALVQASEATGSDRDQAIDWHSRYQQAVAAHAAHEATARELERWRHGVTIEGDFVCPNELALCHERDAHALTRAELAEARRWDDESPDEWTEAISAAFPTRSGSNDEYAIAMRMIRTRRSKGSIVMLVNWLLVDHALTRARLAAAERVVEAARALEFAVLIEAGARESMHAPRAVLSAALAALDAAAAPIERALAPSGGDS